MDLRYYSEQDALFTSGTASFCNLPLEQVKLSDSGPVFHRDVTTNELVTYLHSKPKYATLQGNEGFSQTKIYTIQGENT